MTVLRPMFDDGDSSLLAPFYPTFDFLVIGTESRPINLLHEIITHFDLVITWNSLDAVLSYRLNENNARYGTSVYVIPPNQYGALSIDVLNGNPSKIKDAIFSKEKPGVIFWSQEDDKDKNADLQSLFIV